MALTYSPESDIGRRFSDFSLPSVDGKVFDSSKALSPLVVLFICNHCPYVKAIEDRLLALAHFYSSEKIQFVGVCSNDASDYPEDRPENLLARWKEKSYPFPYLIDADQRLAKDFGAVCTPDIFLLDSERHLVYRGRLDDSWKDASKVKRQDLKEAIDRLLKAETPVENQIPSMGCSIKWIS